MFCDDPQPPDIVELRSIGSTKWKKNSSRSNKERAPFATEQTPKPYFKSNRLLCLTICSIMQQRMRFLNQRSHYHNPQMESSSQKEVHPMKGNVLTPCGCQACKVSDRQCISKLQVEDKIDLVGNKRPNLEAKNCSKHQECDQKLFS